MPGILASVNIWLDWQIGKVLILLRKAQAHTIFIRIYSIWILLLCHFCKQKNKSFGIFQD
jgi:hypothetical protein